MGKRGQVVGGACWAVGLWGSALGLDLGSCGQSGLLLSCSLPFPSQKPGKKMVSRGSPFLLPASVILTTLGVTHISGVTQYLSFPVWLISLNIRSLRLIHVGACVRSPFFFF